MELCLGTVQFGMDYGIFNQKKPSLESSLACIEYAVNNGVKAIDTATAYGDAEKIVGEYLKANSNKRKELFISTKFLPNLLDDVSSKNYVEIIRDNLQKSLKTLHTDYVDAYLLHSARYAFNDEILYALSKMEQEGLAKKVGVSVYEPNEALACLKSPYVNFMQLPYSILDHRMKESGVFNSSLTGKCEIHSRTAFVKGLVKLKCDEVPEYLVKAKPVLAHFDKLCKETGYSAIELAINYVKRENAISHLVIGIRNLQQLKEDIKIFNRTIDKDVFALIDKEFSDVEADIVIPSLWKRG